MSFSRVSPSSPALTRRASLQAFASGALLAQAGRASASPLDGGARGPRSLDAVEAAVGGRVGVFAVDTGSGAELAHRPDERFAMCSTFKWLLGAAVLARVDRRLEALDARVSFGPGDLLEYAPVTRLHVAEGAMTVAALVEAAITQSDNPAANLLLARVGGPPGLTEFCRRSGDGATRLDRVEPALNGNDRGDPRDSTTPRAMAGLLSVLVCGDALAPSSRDRLFAWMRTCQTGHDRLRAGLPVDWTVGDKTGTGEHGAVNDVAVAFPAGRAPIVVASYLSDSASSLPALAAAHAAVGRIVGERFAQARR